VNSFPGNRIATGPTLPNRRKQRTGCLDLRVAAHAGLRRWDIRMRRTFDIRVTVETRHPQFSRVKFMREWNRLLGRVTYARVLGCEVVGDATRRPNDSENRNKCETPQENVRFFRKHHRHKIVHPEANPVVWTTKCVLFKKTGAGQADHRNNLLRFSARIVIRSQTLSSQIARIMFCVSAVIIVVGFHVVLPAISWLFRRGSKV